MSTPELRCVLAGRRRQVGLSLTELAARVGVSRQALTAVEAGRSTPSTAVALRLAQVLGCRVEDLFALQPGAIPAAVAPGSAGSRVALGRVAERWVAHRLDPRSTTPADGVLDETGAVRPLVDPAELERNVLVAGCAPLLGALTGHLHGRHGRATWLHASSGAALDLLAQGLVHVAGLHLAARGAPEVHDVLAREALPGVPLVVVGLVGWRQGLLLAPGNPLGLGAPADLARPGPRLARRSPTAGATRVLERALAAAGARPVRTGPLVSSHVEAAQAVAFGAVDAAVAIEPMAEAFGLPFVPLSEERFELVVRADQADHPGVVRLLDHLSSAGFAREVAGMGAYDVSLAGRVRRVEAA